MLRESIAEAQEGLGALIKEKEERAQSEEDRLLSMDKDLLAKVTFMEEFLESLSVSNILLLLLLFFLTFCQRKATLTNSKDPICSIPLSQLNASVSNLKFTLE